MKKFLLAIWLALILMVSVSVAATPAPFDMAKEWAMMVSPDKDGDYIREHKVNDDGSLTSYGLGYIVSTGEIVIAKDGTVAIYNEKTEELIMIAFMGFGWVPINATRGEILDWCFQLFKELVTRTLI